MFLVKVSVLSSGLVFLLGLLLGLESAAEVGVCSASASSLRHCFKTPKSKRSSTRFKITSSTLNVQQLPSLRTAEWVAYIPAISIKWHLLIRGTFKTTCKSMSPSFVM